MRPRHLTLLSLLMTALLAGCSFLSHKSSRIFSLERIAPEAGVTPATSRGLPIGLDLAELPPGLDRKEIVVRKADHQLEVRGLEQWSAPLGPLVLHTLAFDLAARLPEGMVILPGEAKPVGAIRSVEVVFEELAPGPELNLVLDARWMVRENGRADLTRHERIVTELPALDSANVASGMSRALATLADRIAAQL